MKTLCHFLVCLTAAFPPLFSGGALSLELRQTARVGEGDVLFADITAVCEDADRNFYVLDRKEYLIHKFSPTGKRLLSFGRRGQGPGDLAHPHSLAMDGDQKLVVCEETQHVSFFTPGGRFVKRIRVPTGLDLRFVNDNLFYAWHWLPRGQEQLLIDGGGVIMRRLGAIGKEVFSVSAPDETGRLVMSSFRAPAYTPGFVISVHRGRLLTGISDRYRLTLLADRRSDPISIERDVPPSAITAQERKHLEAEIRASRHLHEWAKREFIRRIPRFKNLIRRIFLTTDFIFVFRMEEIPGMERSGVPLDVFDSSGGFRGTVTVSRVPFHVSNRSFYTVVEDEEGFILEVHHHTIRASL